MTERGPRDKIGALSRSTSFTCLPAHDYENGTVAVGALCVFLRGGPLLFEFSLAQALFDRRCATGGSL